ncbi:sulfur oxidation protein SoxZ [bacterium BMS3Bbin14]|nr:sulfur oxidation protein SoxZ [bacterium BMS3Abin13]GBE52686.1 sulfur oxidation protein SoxZ [bacterium BMS3Bbin14]HDK44530.1 thiosulfate oxidation carrier complex protein SoxZ [Desulfobacteraceae bacterium]HDL98645.1 thiosulfate oxidation carrier complex protein SoxZ [Desulfobacteraceae bacterium]HDO30995.1 thiosulfate oxidation carrier complex protein SoxZ [Desulfobacteraceae bacterium]
MPQGIGKIKIRLPRTVRKGQIITVKTLIIHPMETGLRKNKKTKKKIPAYYINDVSVYYGDQLITHENWSIAVSANPFMSFDLKVDKAAPLKIVWKDIKGGIYQKTVQIEPR